MAVYGKNRHGKTSRACFAAILTQCNMLVLIIRGGYRLCIARIGAFSGVGCSS